jgi:osmoprotectant transport system ATP-binding protein
MSLLTQERSRVPSVEFRRVRVEIGGRTILSDVNFSVEPGETVVLLGRSGSGKSTALKLVNGMLFPTEGEVLVDGRSTRAWDPIQLKRRIGYVIQDVGLFPHFTIARNVGLVPKLEGWGEGDIEARVGALLKIVGMPAEEYGARYPRQLSGGQRQRVGIARALAADPGLLLFDEPFGALDPVTRFELQEHFLGWRRELNKTALFVTHDVREALRLGNRIVILSGGQVEAVSSVEEFVDLETAEARAFLGTM